MEINFHQYLKIDGNIYLKGMYEYSKYTESFRKRVKYSQWALFVIVIIFLITLVVYIKIATPLIFVAAINKYSYLALINDDFAVKLQKFTNTLTCEHFPLVASLTLKHIDDELELSLCEKCQ